MSPVRYNDTVIDPYIGNSLPELVKEGQNGLIFTSSEQLAKQFEVNLSVYRLSLS